jgi:microcin C transport system substrate-binding protein
LRAPLKSLFLFTMLILSGVASTHAEDWLHGSALTGTPRYSAGFSHFNYVDPKAPKGGAVRQAQLGSFDTFNPILPKGEVAPGLSDTFETLTVAALDELDISSTYGLLAEAIKYPADFSSVSFRLNARAKWHDGMPVTSDDVIWSFEKQIEHSPQAKFYYQNVVKAEKSGEREVKFTFDVKGNRELPHIMGQLIVLPKHWWEDTGTNGKQRNIGDTTLELPLGSGPYRIKAFEAGRFVTYERVADYWGANLNVNIGKNNFDEMRYDLYRDETVMIEAFKSDAYDYRFERSSKNWATGYEKLPARDKGYIKLEEFPRKSAGVMQAFVPNLRREKFKDIRVRQALAYAFDFETTNRNAFFGLYQRANSFYSGTKLASSGLPSPEELALLEPLRGKIPDAVFSKPFENPVGGDNTKMRANFREALRLLKEAGWSLQGNRLLNDKTGEPFIIDYIDYSPVGERYVLPFQSNLQRIGIKVDYRMLDSSAYEARVRKFDFDMIGTVWGESLSPGNEQREYWGASSANREGSRNYAGIADPAVDALIDKVIFASDRPSLITATRALDRVLLANHFVIPQWYSQNDRYAYWDRFGRPQKLPEFSFGFPEIWWFDKEKAARIK